MFRKIAKFWSCELRRVAPSAVQAVHSSNKHSNDNRPGLRRPTGQRRSPHPGLVCHWTMSEDSGRLVCCWQTEDDVATSADEPGRSRVTNRAFARLRRAAG